MTIDDNNIVDFVHDNRTRVNINKPTLKRKRSNFELSEVDQIVIRLDEVKFGNALIKVLVAQAIYWQTTLSFTPYSFCVIINSAINDVAI